MKRALVVLISLFLLFSFSFLVYGNQRERILSTFEQKPITRGICEDTAYTLNQGGLKLGDLSVPGQISQWKWVYLKYGLTEDLQVCTTIPQNFLGRPNFSAKYHLTSDVLGGADVAIPADMNIYVSPAVNLSLSSGLVASWKLNREFGFHSGANIWFSSYGTLSPSAYVMTDYNILSNAKLISELESIP